MRFSSPQLLDATPNSPRRATPKCAASTGGRDDHIDRWVSQIHAEMQSADSDQRAPPSSKLNRIAEQRRIPTEQQSATTVEVTLEFGRTRVSPTATTLAPGAVLKLDQRAEEPIDILVGIRTIACGELLVVDGKLGIKILERLDHMPVANGATYD